MQLKSLSHHGEFQHEDLARIVAALMCDQPELAAVELLEVAEQYRLPKDAMALLVVERIAHQDKVLRILCPDVARVARPSLVSG